MSACSPVGSPVGPTDSCVGHQGRTVYGNPLDPGMPQDAEADYANPVASSSFDKEQATGAPPSNSPARALRKMPSVDEFENNHAQVMPESLKEAEWLKRKAKLGEQWLALSKETAENERDRTLRINLEYLAKSNLLAPDSRFRTRWDLFQLVAVVYVAIIVPYRLGFSVDVEFLSFPFFYIDLIVDIYFIIDVIIAMRTAYYNTVGELIVSEEEIKKNYIWTPPYWFFIDVAACFPGTYIEWYLQHSMKESMTDSEGSSNRMLRLMRLLRLLKLLRLLRLNRLMMKYEEELQHFITTLQVWLIFIGMAVVGHWLACFWYWAGSEGSDFSDTAEACGAGENGEPAKCAGWVNRRFGDGAAARDLNTTGGVTPEDTRYFASVYWSIMTMTTVGYGDITPETGTEVIAAIIGMIIGGFMFGLIVGALAELSRKSDAENLMRGKALSKVSALLHCGIGNGVPKNLQRRVRSYPLLIQFTYYTAHFKAKTHMNLLPYMATLPVDLRDELAEQFRWIDSESDKGSGLQFGILHKVPFFADLDNLSCIQICSRLKYVMQRPIVQLDDGSRSNFIMREGFIVISGNGVLVEAEGKQLGELHAGDFCGELAVLFRPGSFKDDQTGQPLKGHRRLRSVYASTMDVSLGILSYDDLAALVTERPQIAEVVLPYIEAIRGTILPDSSGSSVLSPPASSGSNSSSSSGGGLSSADDERRLQALVDARVEERLQGLEQRLIGRIEELLSSK